MSIIIDNLPGREARLAINQALQELVQWFAGAVPPAQSYAHQIWVDTQAGLIKRRNSTNSAWAVVGKINADGTLTWYFDGVSPGLLAAVKTTVSAAAAPQPTDDASGGWSVGSIWAAPASRRVWICLGASVGAAVWTELTAAVVSVGAAGLCPAPSAADAAARRVLAADATWRELEWMPLAEVAPPSGGTAIELVAATAGQYRRLRLRGDVLVPSTPAAISLQLRVGGQWRTGSAEYEWTGTYVTSGAQVQTGAAAAAVPLTYSGWAAFNDLDCEIVVTTQNTRPVIKARGAYGRSGGGRGMFDLDCWCTFTGAVDGARLNLSTGVWNTMLGRLILEGSAT